MNYETIKQLMASLLARDSAQAPRPELVQSIAISLGLDQETIERLIVDLTDSASESSSESGVANASAPALTSRTASTNNANSSQPAVEIWNAAPSSGTASFVPRIQERDPHAAPLNSKPGTIPPGNPPPGPSNYSQFTNTTSDAKHNSQPQFNSAPHSEYQPRSETPSRSDSHSNGPGNPTAATAAAESNHSAPFLFVRLGEDLRPGVHLSPEFHVFFSGWDGDVHVEATIHGALDKTGWNEKPRITPETNGYSIFHQSLHLNYNGSPCPSGEYRLEFDCHFHSSRQHIDTRWRGWFHFCVHDQDNAGPVLEVVSDGHSLVNLHGLNLKQFSKLRFESRDHALVNLQSFLSEVETEAARNSQSSASQSKMIPVALRPIVFDPPPPPALPVHQARFDLPDGRRLILLAQNKVILGRNRPNPHAAANELTDLALRMYPRSEALDGITQCISKQHLLVAVSENKIIIEDPRRADIREAYPATVNNSPLTVPVQIRHSDRLIKYQTRFSSTRPSDQPARQIGLQFQSFYEQQMSRTLLPQLEALTRGHPEAERWLRDAANLDAVLIERAGNPDALDGKEAYLMVLGVVFIGSEPRCPIRLTDPSVEGLHAALCHWDGQFRIFSMGNSAVRCDGRRVGPGQCGTLNSGKTLTIGDVELKLETASQFGL